MSSTPDPRSLVDVVWAEAADDNVELAHRLLTTLVAGRTGTARDDVRLGHLCPRCGADDHGRPVVVGPGAPREFVSVARCSGITVVTASHVGPVGVDVETVGATRFEGFPNVALHPGERDGSPAERAALWTRKEAVLKASGAGVGWGPDRVWVGSSDQRHGRVQGLPIRSGSVAWATVEIDPRYAAAVAVVGTEPPVVRVRRATRGDVSR